MSKAVAIIILAATPCWATNPCGSVVRSSVVKSLPINSYATSYNDFQTTSAYAPVQYVYTVGMSVREQSYRTKLSQAEQKAAQAQGIIEGMERAMRLMQGRAGSLEPTPAGRSIVSERCGICHGGDSPAGGVVYDDGPYSPEQVTAALRQIYPQDLMPRVTEQQKAAGKTKDDVKLSREEKNEFLTYLLDNTKE